MSAFEGDYGDEGEEGGRDLHGERVGDLRLDGCCMILSCWIKVEVDDLKETGFVSRSRGLLGVFIYKMQVLRDPSGFIVDSCTNDDICTQLTAEARYRW